MRDDLDDVSAVIRQAAAEARSAHRLHISADHLVAYHEDRLGDQDADAVQEHLVLCHECARLLLDLNAFPDLPAEGDKDDAVDVAKEWTALRATLDATQAKPMRSRAGWAAAAVFACVSFGLGLRAFQLEARLSGPRSNVLLVDIRQLDDVARGAGVSWPEVRFGASQEHAVLIMSAPDAEPGKAYEARLLDADAPSRAIWRSPGLRATADRLFIVEVSRSTLTTGRYLIRFQAPALKAIDYGFVVP